MKTLNHALFLLLIVLVITSCSRDDSFMPELSQTLDTENVVTRFSSDKLDVPHIERPDLNPYAHADTTHSWVFDVKVDKYINGTYYLGNKGRYTQLQYTTVRYPYENDWKDVTVQVLNPIHVSKKDYPYGDIYFRARTMDDADLVKVESIDQYLYSSKLSPWSEPLYARNNIFKDDISLTKNNVIVDLNFLFIASYSNYMNLSDFRAQIIYGDKVVEYKVADPYLKRYSFDETYTFTIDKNYFSSNETLVLTVVNRSISSNISFNPQVFNIQCRRNAIDMPISCKITVDFR